MVNNVEYKSSIFLEASHDLFIHSIEIAESQYKLDSTNVSWYTEYELARIRTDIETISQNKDCIIDLFEKWYAARLVVKKEQRNPFESAMYYSCTAELILQFSKMLAIAVD